MVWMDINPMEVGRDYLIKHLTKIVKGVISEVNYKFDPEDVHRKPADHLELNEMGKVKIDFKSPIFADIYSKNRNTGSFIIIDPITNQTAAAGMITRHKQVSPDRACGNISAKVMVYPIEEVSTAKARYDQLSMQGSHCIYVDDELLQKGLCIGLGVNEREYSRRVRELCDIVTKSGVSVVICTGSGFSIDNLKIRKE